MRYNEAKIRRLECGCKDYCLCDNPPIDLEDRLERALRVGDKIQDRITRREIALQAEVHRE